MANEDALKKDWVVTPEAFEKMLRWLDADLEVAGEKYEKVRSKLIKLFKWRNVIPEEEYADITINRVTRRIGESTDVTAENPYSYFHGTALNVIREYWRGQLKHKHTDIDTTDQTAFAVGDAEEELERREDEAFEQRRFGCMRECINGLPADTRDMMLSYHHGDNKKESRKLLSTRLGIDMNVLRIRICRIRDSLKGCVGKCIKRFV